MRRLLGTIEIWYEYWKPKPADSYESSQNIQERRFSGDSSVHLKQTMRRFDESCLTPVHEFTAEEIRALREREEVSQKVFALYLNVTKDSVSQWERGQKKPAGPTLKLLSLVRRKGLNAIAWQSREYDPFFLIQ